MAKTLTRKEVIEMMRKKQGSKTIAQFAQELGISQPHLSDIYNGKKDIGEKLAAALGLERETVFHS
jgi:plasmid maintenance system antidote protein VapI